MATTIQVTFSDGFNGTLTAPNAEVPIGMNEGQARPYELLFGALASCFYSTFLDILVKKRRTFDCVTIEVTGEKRDEIPPTLETCSLKITVYGADNEQGFDQAASLAAKYCSIYQTIAKVAEMAYTVHFA